MQNWDIVLAKISVPSFRNVPYKLSMPAALDGFKPFKIHSIFSGGVSENWKSRSLKPILSKYGVTFDSVKIFDKEGSLDTKFCTRLEKKFLKIDQFFVSSKAISFLSFKQINGDAALDGQHMDFKVFSKFLRFIYVLLEVNVIEISSFL